jgi:hypothetical protein
MSISSKDTEKLFRQFRHSIGAPIRQIEVTDEMLCTYLKYNWGLRSICPRMVNRTSIIIIR